MASDNQSAVVPEADLAAAHAWLKPNMSLDTMLANPTLTLVLQTIARKRSRNGTPPATEPTTPTKPSSHLRAPRATLGWDAKRAAAHDDED